MWLIYLRRVFQAKKDAEEPAMLQAGTLRLLSVAAAEHGSVEQRWLTHSDEGVFPLYTWPQIQGCPWCSDVSWLLQLARRADIGWVSQVRLELADCWRPDQ